MSVTPKRPMGPPLNAMRAFEAAARHVSFAMAAEELNVSPGAISQHVKTLERWAGVPLFYRHAKGVDLTPAGQALVGDFEAAFDALAVATQSLRTLKPIIDVHIAALPSVAQLWLPKRLSKIRERFPDLNVSVTAMENAPNLSRELFDLSIFFARPEDVKSQITLCKDTIAPVCAPALLHRIQSAGGFDLIPLLHDQTWAQDWQIWAQHAGVPLRDSQSGSRFSLYSLAVEEAKAGAGALIGHLCLIEDDLSSGVLNMAHEVSYDTGKSLVINLPNPSRCRPQTDQLVQLLCDVS